MSCNCRECQTARRVNAIAERVREGGVNTTSDRERLDWLEERSVVAVYFADHGQLNPGSVGIRAAIDAARGLPPQADSGVFQTGGGIVGVEFICRKCGLRTDSPTDNTPDF